MADVHIGINLEFVRHADKPFGWAIEKAAQIGYEYVEPWVHWGRELLSEEGFYMSYSLLDDPYVVKSTCEKAGIKLSGLSAHSALCRPEVGIESLKQAVRFAAECGAPVVNTDEGIKEAWTTEEEDYVLIRYALKQISALAEPRGILLGIEPHQQYSKTPEGLNKIINLVDSPAIGVNFDTGNSYLCGYEPADWLEQVKQKLVHLHAKDISVEKSKDQRGKVTGTPSGCACGDGVVQWEKIIEICKSAPRDIVMSVECGTIEQAEKSLKYLKDLI